MFDVEAGELVFLDLGLMGWLDSARRIDLIDLLLSFQQNDAGGLTTLLLRLTDAPKDIDVAGLRDDIQEFLSRFVRFSTDPTFSFMAGALFALLQKHELQLDSQFTLAIKAVAQLESVILKLGVELDFVDFALHEVVSLTVAEITVDSVKDRLEQQAVGAGRQLLRELLDLERAAGMWLQELKTGQLEMHIDTSDLEPPVRGLQRALEFLAAGFVLAVMTLATAYLTVHVSQLWSVLAGLLLFGGGLLWRMTKPSQPSTRRSKR